MKAKMKAISLFSSAGVGELFLDEIGISITAANELLPRRADCFSYFFPTSQMITGDIKEVKAQLIASAEKNVRLLLATPPCQGLSTLGKNKLQDDFIGDERNFLIFDVFEIIDKGNFDFILIENVPKFLEMYFPYKGKLLKLMDIIDLKYGEKFTIESAALDAQNYGVPQTRPRAVIKMYKPQYSWPWPKKSPPISLEKAIGHLPSLEAGEDSGIMWHSAKQHPQRITHALKHTPPGKSALINTKHYPKKEDGERIKGFHNTFKRMVWDKPAHARTTFSGSISSHNNVHPGRLLPDGTHSDARVLTILETLLVHSMKKNMSFPEWATDTFIRQIIGESIPPLMLKKILQEIQVLKVEK
jgi:DNA (cytosine-5)-methyltransferase 1